MLTVAIGNSGKNSLNRFIHNHHRRGIKQSATHLRRLKKAQKKYWSNESNYKKRCKINKKKTRRKKISRVLRRMYRDGTRKLAGAAVKLNRVSKLEIEIARQLRKKSVTFKTQFRIEGTRYRVDFYFPSSNTVVEIDGHPSHYENRGRINHDNRRQRRIEKLGYKVFRIRRRSLKKGTNFCLAQMARFK